MHWNAQAGPADVPEEATQYMVAMRDGVRLATDVYLPVDASSPTPAVLVRLPYDKNSRYVFMAQVAERLTAKGYALVVQDVRGKYRSEGLPLGPTSESRDGFDTIDWVSKQPWCDGRVGMFGDSYYGFTQWAALSSQHPALRALVPRMTTTTIGTPTIRENVQDIPWMQHADYMMRCWTGPYVFEEQPDFTVTPLTDAFEQYFERMGQRSLWYDLAIPREIPIPTFPDGHPYDVRPIPTLHCVGWYDNLLIRHMRDYEALMAVPAAAPYQYLYADATDHENYHLSKTPIAPADDHNTDDAALQRMLNIYIDPAIEFFEVFLKGVAPIESVPRVQWNLGHVGYRQSTSWPPPEAQRALFFLVEGHDDGSDGALSPEPPPKEASWEWSYDPDNLVPSLISNSFAFLYEYPDEKERRDHADVLVFSGPHVEEPIDLAGPVDITLRVASTASTTDVFAKLCDLAPDGSLRQIARGQAQLDQPNGAELREIGMGHVGYRVRPGHRLQLLIASSDFPEFPPNSGSDESRWTVAKRVGSEQRLSSSTVEPSHLSLTVLPSER
jgi:hypothetical protein